MSRPRTYRPSMERLEDRCVPSTFTVTNLKDGPAAAPPANSLRAAITAANDNGPGLDTIVFKPGLEGTIKLSGTAIAITSNLTLLGPGAAKVTLDGNAASRIFTIDDGTSTARKVSISGLTFFNGRTSESGGAISSFEKLTLMKTIFVGNVVAIDVGGGAIWSAQDLKVKKSGFIGNTAAEGGAIYADGANVTVAQCRLIGNRGYSGGAIYAASRANSVQIVDSVIAGNRTRSTGSHGGGIWSGCFTTIRGSTISDNFAMTSGGGIYQSNGTLTVEKSTIANNQASGNQGGGVWTDAANTTFNNSKITNNIAASSGGGLLASGQTTINCSIIQGNTALGGGRGGGIRQVGGLLAIFNSTISANHADGSQGGGIFVNDPSPFSTIRGSTIAGNWANMGGGGLYIELATQFTVSNCTFSGNRTEASGGAIFLDRSVLSVFNSNIAFNQANSTGGGISAVGVGTVVLNSTIVALNSGGAKPDLDSATTAFLAAFSLIGTIDGATDFKDGEGNIYGAAATKLDPLLAPLANNGGPTQTHAVKKGSLAINKGSNAAASLFDQRGAPFKRLVGGAVDIGAFERQ